MPLEGKGSGAGRSRWKWPLVVVMAAVGCVWLGQGLGLIGGSFMTGQPLWGIVGAVLLIGAILLAGSRRS